jgi:prepilin-type N-terminal cleavage/methylation domain-containing protein/prepilin-type processing-associated H-X9-DG protein
MRGIRRDISRGFTLIELLVVVAIIAVLIAILLPVLSRARDVANSVACASNLRQIYVAMVAYAQDGTRYLPFASMGSPNEPAPGQPVDPALHYCLSWDDLINRQLGGNFTDDEKVAFFAPREMKVLECPGDDRPRIFTQPHFRRSYTMPRLAIPAATYNQEFYRGTGYSLGTGLTTMWSSAAAYKVCIRLTEVRRPAETFMLVEWGDRYNALGSQEDASVDVAWSAGSAWKPPHRGKYNCLFHDGHVLLLAENQTLGSGTPMDPRGMWSRDPND